MAGSHRIPAEALLILKDCFWGVCREGIPHTLTEHFPGHGE